MAFTTFIASVLFISLSGVLAPGPLLATTMAEGKMNRYAGFFISIGHATVEIPIILGLFLFGSVIINDELKSVIGIVGGMVLLYFAYNEIRTQHEARPMKGIVSGILMSSLNPYFIIWWLTIGFSLVLQSIEFGILGIVAFIIAHEMCDFLWLGFVSMLSFKSSKALGPMAEKSLTIISVAILIVFGSYFVYEGAGFFL